MYFHYFVIISPWKRAGPFISTNLNPLNPRMLCAKFSWNWPSGYWEEVEKRKSLQTDRRWMTGDQKSSLELSAQVFYKIHVLQITSHIITKHFLHHITVVLIFPHQTLNLISANVLCSWTPEVVHVVVWNKRVILRYTDTSTIYIRKFEK